MFWGKSDCVLPCMLNVTWLKTWCRSKISWLWYQRVPCLKEYCNVISLVVSSFFYLWMFFPGSWNSVEVEDGTPSQRDLVLTAQPFQKGIAQEQPPASGHKGHYLSAVGVEGTSLWCKCHWNPADPQLGVLRTARRPLKHMVQVCQCLNPPCPLAFCRACMSMRRGFHQGSSCLQTNGQANLRYQQKGNMFEVHQTQFPLVLSCKAKLPWSFSSDSIALVTGAPTACQGHSCTPAGCCSLEPPSLSFIHCCSVFQDLSDLCILLKRGRDVSFTSLEIFLCQTAECAALLQ